MTEPTPAEQAAADDINALALHVGASRFEILSLCECGGPVARLHWQHLSTTAAVSIHANGCPHAEPAVDDLADQLERLPAELEHVWRLT